MQAYYTNWKEKGVKMMRLWLKTLRKEKKMTMKETGAELGVTESAYSQIEKGDRQKDLGLSYAKKISAVFGVTLDEIADMEAESAQ